MLAGDEDEDEDEDDGDDADDNDDADARQGEFANKEQPKARRLVDPNTPKLMSDMVGNDASVGIGLPMNNLPIENSTIENSVNAMYPPALKNEMVFPPPEENSPGSMPADRRSLDQIPYGTPFQNGESAMGGSGTLGPGNAIENRVMPEQAEQVPTLQNFGTQVDEELPTAMLPESAVMNNVSMPGYSGPQLTIPKITVPKVTQLEVTLPVMTVPKMTQPATSRSQDGRAIRQPTALIPGAPSLGGPTPVLIESETSVFNDVKASYPKPKPTYVTPASLRAKR